MENPTWYVKYVKEVEFRAVREDDKYEVGCDQCGYRDHIYSRRWPREKYVEYTIGRGCTCDQT